MGEKEPFTNFSFDSMLPLDMLAEVASETLKSDPTLGFKRENENRSSQNNVGKSCVQKRSATNCEVLNLDQIRVLSDKMLIEMFSEHSSDEIRKNYSYKCFLMPEKCGEVFTSFGNETKARLQIKSHLLTHIAQLLTEENAPGMECNNHFVAEPLSVRRRRLQEGSPKKKKKGKIVSKRIKNSLTKRMIDKRSNSSKPRILKEDDSERKLGHPHKFAKSVSDQAAAANVFVAKTHTRLRKSMHSYNIKKRLEKENGYKKLPSALEDLYFAMQKVANSNHDVQEDLNKINNYIDVPPDVKGEECTAEIWNPVDASMLGDHLHSSDGNEIPGVPLEYIHNENFSNSLDFCKKPLVSEPQCFPHDHTYTSVNGKTYVGDSIDVGKCPLKEGRKLNNSSAVAAHLVIPTAAFPYVYEPVLPHIAEIKEVRCTNKRSYDKCSSINNSSAATCSIKKTSINNSSSSSYNVQSPVLPVSKPVRYRKVNRLIIPEEMEPDSEDDENVPVSFTVNFVKERLCDPVSEDVSSEQQLSPTLFADKNNSTENLGERKLALKCIRALRMKKKDERGPLICQICNGKSFTAQATLMYHYRSHAGIKPFTCSVCDATFTRQHSLNYHMLIHNNKSRFICDECGRSFRHPSHYKEHLRRHTGETPYQCTDCSLRFKTRNTYKRHLKTRHGKILTARGIRILSVEEFDKVRTMPRRRTSKLVPEVQENQWSDLTFSQIPEVKTEILDK